MLAKKYLLVGIVALLSLSLALSAQPLHPMTGEPLVIDCLRGTPDAIDGEIYFLTLKDLHMYRMSDYQWMDKDGAVLARISGYDAYEAVLFRYAELGCKRRNSHGVLCDLNYEN